MEYALIIPSVQVAKELGSWTIRVNGVFIADFWRKSKAMEIGFRLSCALAPRPPEEAE